MDNKDKCGNARTEAGSLGGGDCGQAAEWAWIKSDDCAWIWPCGVIRKILRRLYTGLLQAVSQPFEASGQMTVTLKGLADSVARMHDGCMIAAAELLADMR